MVCVFSMTGKNIVRRPTPSYTYIYVCIVSPMRGAPWKGAQLRAPLPMNVHAKNRAAFLPGIRYWYLITSPEMYDTREL